MTLAASHPRVLRFGGWIGFLAVAYIPIAVGDPQMLALATLAALWALWAISLNIVWGYAGQFSMAQVALGGLAAYTSALLVADRDWNTWAAVGAGVAMAVLFSILIGLFALRLHGFYFAIMTLAFALMFQTFMSNWEIAGRETGLAVLNTYGGLNVGPIQWNLDGSDGGFYILLILFVVAFLVASGRLLRMRSGRALLAIREDEILASSLGVHPARYRVLAFALSAVVAAVAGTMYATYLKYITPGFFGQDNLVTMIVVLVVGGAGLRFGPLVGAGIYVLLVDWLPIGGQYRNGIFGAVLILTVLFSHHGVVGTVLEIPGAVRRLLRPPPRDDGTEPPVDGENAAAASRPAIEAAATQAPAIQTSTGGR